MPNRQKIIVDCKNKHETCQSHETLSEWVHWEKFQASQMNPLLTQTLSELFNEVEFKMCLQCSAGTEESRLEDGHHLQLRVSTDLTIIHWDSWTGFEVTLMTRSISYRKVSSLAS